MKGKAFLGLSVSAIVGLAGLTPAFARTAAQDEVPGKPKPLNAQGSPKPITATDQSVDPANPAPQEQDTPQEGGDIVVTGIRRSLASAQELKKNSDGIVDAIVAEDIGKLPDTFASAALARVPGVSVTRAAGEAADVRVRGLPNLTTTYNGRDIFTAEGRFVQIQDFPAGTVSALEVYKSGTANLIEAGIAGEINVRGRKPFDFNGFELSGSINAVNWQQSQQFSGNGNLLISNRWETGIGEIGILANASWVGIDFLDSTREQSVVIQTANAGQTAGTPGFRYPDAQALYYGGGHRWRPSANGAIQWKPTPDLEIYADGLFQGYRGNDNNRYMFVPIFGGNLNLSNVVLQADGTRAQSLTVSGANAPDGFYASGKARTNTYQGGGGFIWNRDKLQISADAAYTKSTYTGLAVNIDYAFASSPVRTVNFDVPGNDGGPSFDFGAFDVTNPANFLSRGLFQENLRAQGKDVQARADLKYEIGLGFLRNIQFGVRYTDRDANRRRGSLYINNLAQRVPLASLPVSLGTTRPGFAYNNAFPTIRFVDIPSTSIRENLGELRQFFGVPEGFPDYSLGETFFANEKSYTAYGQIKYGFDLGTIGIDGLAGVRVIKTKTNLSVPTNDLPGDSEYTDYLPNVSARVKLMDQLQLRAAFTQTRTRPDFGQLIPFNTIATTSNGNGADGRPIFNASQGNPNLQPLKSDNYDVTLEYYFSATGALTGGLFRRDATGFIANVDTIAPDPNDPTRLLRTTQPRNTGNTRLQGAELAFTSFLDFAGLPAWARGFGVQANGTYIDAKGDLVPVQAATVGNQQQPFAGVSKWTANLVGIYERPQFSARLAYNYRSKYARSYSIEPFDPVAHAIIERARGQLDLSTTVTPVPNITIAFDISNLLGNPLRRYREFSEQDGLTFPRQVQYLERAYSLGLRFRF